MLNKASGRKINDRTDMIKGFEKKADWPEFRDAYKPERWVTPPDWHRYTETEKRQWAGDFS